MLFHEKEKNRFHKSCKLSRFHATKKKTQFARSQKSIRVRWHQQSSHISLHPAFLEIKNMVSLFLVETFIFGI